MTVRRNQVVGGRAATVSYLDEDFLPSSPDDATLAKVIYDDGDSRWLRFTRSTSKLLVTFGADKPEHSLIVKFDPDQSRDDRGRWAGPNVAAGPDDAGYNFYHGTSSEALGHIMTDGLIPGGGKGADAWLARSWGDKKLMEASFRVGGREASVYMTDDPDLARTFAKDAAEVTGSEPVLLSIFVPEEHAGRFHRDESMKEGWRFEGAIPPAWIEVMKKIRSGRKIYAILLTRDLAKKLLVKFSQDQPRDDRGRWSGGNFDDSLGIPRHQMPQIPNFLKEEFARELATEGVAITRERVAADSLRPSQGTYNSTELAGVRSDLFEHGHVGKHGPIVVSDDDRVLDGHHRWAAVREQGGQIDVIRFHLPIEALIDRARVFNDKHGIQAEKYSASQPRDERGRWASISDDMNLDRGGDQNQPVRSTDELYERSRAEEQSFKDAVESAARSAGGRAVYTPAEFAEPGTTLKSRASADRKVKDEYGGDASKLKDVLRATVVHDTVAGARQAAADFIREQGDSVLRVKDRFVHDLAGYRDILINYRTPGGLVAEVQFNGDRMFVTKNGPGHAIYEEIRRPGTKMDQIPTLEARQRTLYNAAYEEDGDHRGW